MSIERLRPMLVKAGLPEEEHDCFLEGVSSFTTMMTVLLKANDEDAPNYLTFALNTPAGERYELTIRKCDGKTPAEVIDDKDAMIAALRSELLRYEEAGTGK